MAVVAKLIGFVVPLGLDTFAVAAALGMAGIPPRQRLRVSLLMVSFEAGMPLVGVAAGAPLGHAIGSAADYVAIGILIALGLYTLLPTNDDDDERVVRLGSLRGWPAVALGISISLDELAVGFTLGLLRLPIWAVVVMIAAQAFILSQLGMRLGARLGARAAESAGRLAGVALVALGVGLLLARLA